MTARPDGGGGGVVLVDPDSLRQAAGKLRGVSGELSSLTAALGGDAFPTMPPGVAAAVQGAIAEAVGGICTQPAALDDTCVELTRRAFWAQYADSLMGGYALSGPARQEFLSYLRDGTLLRYATPEEAVAAGMELALVSRSFRRAQGELLQLAAALQGVERSGIPTAELQAFSAAFVNRFGAKNMGAVPRVIQAMEWSRAIAFGQSTDPNLMRDVARQWSDRSLQTNPVKDLLAPFSVALANATLSGQLTRTVEEGIADGEDTWSTAMLLSQGDRFDTGFLLECFRTGVVKKVADDSRSYGPQNLGGEPPPGDEYALGQMWSDGKEHVPFDTKQIVLDALARNPAAAAQALTQTLPAVQVFDGMGNRVEVSDPMQLLYRYGHFDDQGAAFGRAYAAAADQLNADPGDALARQQGSLLTKAALDEMLGHDHDGMSAFKDGLAHDLAQNHIKDLFDSAVANDPGDSGTMLVGPAHDGSPLRLSQSTLTDTLKSLSDRSTAFSTVLHAGSIYQAALIDDGTSQPHGGDASWAYKAGAFDASVLNAADLHRLDQFDAADRRHQLIAGFFKGVVDDTVEIDNPIAGAIVHNGVDAGIDRLFPGPSAGSMIVDDTQAKALMSNSLHAAIVAGYYEHGQLQQAPPPSVLRGDRLASYGSLRGNARFDYEEWMNGNGHVEEVTRTAMQEASRAYEERSVDLIR